MRLKPTSLVRALISAALLFFAGEFFDQLEQRSGDLIWRLGAQRSDERRLIVVDIDERSLREVGAWPWPHDIQARLIEQIAVAGARQQIFDVVFTDAQANEQAFAEAARTQGRKRERHRQQGGREVLGRFVEQRLVDFRALERRL